jgi:hypothetical protein
MVFVNIFKNSVCKIVVLAILEFSHGIGNLCQEQSFCSRAHMFFNIVIKKITWIYLDISKWWYSKTVVFKDDKKGLV